jgi:hypothetical protein
VKAFARRSGVYALICLFVFTTTAQQAVGIVSTVANLVEIVQGTNASPLEQGQPVADGAVYRASQSSAAEFSFPEGLRAAAGPSSSVAFHPSPAGAGTRLVALSEGVFRFALPNQGDRIDIATPAGAMRVVAAAPDSEIITRVGADGTVEITATKGRVELRDWASGALLLLLLDGHSATFGAGAANSLALQSQGAADPQAMAQAAQLSDILAGKVPPPPAPPAAPAEAPSGESSGLNINWGSVAIAVGTFIVVGVLAVIASRHGHGGGHHGNGEDSGTDGSL